jgi:hypothetical protein
VTRSTAIPWDLIGCDELHGSNTGDILLHVEISDNKVAGASVSPGIGRQDCYIKVPIFQALGVWMKPTAV